MDALQLFGIAVVVGYHTVESNRHPVVYLRLQEPERRFQSPNGASYGGVPYTLRVVSCDHTAMRLSLSCRTP